MKIMYILYKFKFKKKKNFQFGNVLKIINQIVINLTKLSLIVIRKIKDDDCWFYLQTFKKILLTVC